MDWHQIFAQRTDRMKASEIRELLKLLDQPGILSFAGGIPDPALFPAEAFAQASAEVLSGPQSGAALQYSVSEGYRPLRDWIATRMAGLGIPCDADNILITTGSQQALDYLGRLMINPGDTVLMGWPTYMGALGAFNAYEPRYDRLVPGSNRPAADFAQAAHDAGGAVKFAYLSVDFANPTGETLDRTQRDAVLDMADTLNIAVVEDAAYQGLRFEGEALAPILAMEIARKGSIDQCRTLYCGSFSKTLSPGLRVGWVCAARAVIGKLVLMKQAADLHSPTLNQILTHRVAESGFDAHLETLRRSYGARRDAMLSALSDHMPAGVSWTQPEGGMFVWLTLPEQIDTAELLARALQEEQVAFVPGRAFFPDGSNGHCLRLAYSCATSEQIDEGMKRLGRVIEREMAEPKGRHAAA